jgi:GT2 family glycosyltransferase/ADP-heptose:LPS heptosyltransferase
MDNDTSRRRKGVAGRWSILTRRLFAASSEFCLAQPPSPRVAIIIVTWNGREHLRRCLDALADQTFRDFITVVVDNASTDATAAMVRAAYPDVVLIESSDNLGFAAANNVGIRATTTPFVVTLNNDTRPDPDWLDALVRMADADPALGSVASRMVSARNPAMIDSCGIALDAAGIAWDLFGGFPARAIDRPRDVFGPCAGAALYRRSMLDDVGLFDEDFFAYLEDVDLAWRARLRGWRARLQPEAVVRHEHAGTLGDASPLKRYLLARNKLWTVAKNLPAAGLWWRLPLTAGYDVGAVSFGVARQRDWASLHGRLAGLAGLPAALTKRRTIQARRTQSGSDVARQYAPLAWPWDVPRRYRHLTNGVSDLASDARAARPRQTQPHLKETLRGMGLWVAGRLLRQSPARRAGTPEAGMCAAPGAKQVRLVVVRPDHLGDALLSRPALELLRRSLPEGKITLLAGPWNVPAVRDLPPRIVTFPFPGFTRVGTASFAAPYRALFALALRLRRERYDAALLLRADHWWGALAIALAGIPIRVGYGASSVAPFLTTSIELDATEPTSRSALRVTRALLEELGASPVDVDLTPRFDPGAEARRAARAWLDTHTAGARPRVALHPGTGVRLKCWPASRWARVLSALGDDTEIILTGTMNEAPLLDAIQDAVGSPIPTAVDLPWDTLAALYEQVDLVIGMDSGPLHLATAVGTPTVRGYGPTDPAVWGPAGPAAQHAIVQASLGCVPCGSLDVPPCGHLADPPCLAAIQPERVIELARALLPNRVMVAPT